MSPMRPRAPALAALLGLLVAAPLGAEPPGPDCRFEAWVDADALGRYDGLRLGLERARLPRVCRADLGRPPPDDPAAPARLLGEAFAAGRLDPPLFLVGEEAFALARAHAADLPAVYALVRYRADGAPLGPLPAPPGWTGVVAEVDARVVGRLVGEAFPGRTPRVGLAPGSDGEAAARLARAAGLDLAGPEGPLDALLHLTLVPGQGAPDFAAALAAARARGALLFSDERGRFGQGAAVLLLADEDLLGRQAAEQARRWRAEPGAPPAPRALQALEVWVDLEALDRQGVELPLAFLARADRLRRAPPPGPADGR